VLRALCVEYMMYKLVSKFVASVFVEFVEKLKIAEIEKKLL